MNLDPRPDPNVSVTFATSARTWYVIARTLERAHVIATQLAKPNSAHLIQESALHLMRGVDYAGVVIVHEGANPYHIRGTEDPLANFLRAAECLGAIVLSHSDRHTFGGQS